MFSNRPSGESKKSLVIGYFVDNGFFTPSRSHQRAVLLAVEELKKKGHTVVPFQPHDVLEAHECFFTFVAGDGAWNVREMVKKEAVDPCISNLWSMMVAPWIVRAAIRTAALLVNWKRLAAVLRIWSGSAAYEHKTIHWKNKYRAEMISRMQAAGLDAIVCPGPGIPPPHHNQAQMMAPALGYTYYWNVIRFPGVAFPVTTVTSEDTTPPRRVQDLTDAAAKRAETGSEGLPVSVQVVSFPFSDETVLRVASELSHLVPDMVPQMATSIATNLV